MGERERRQATALVRPLGGTAQDDGLQWYGTTAWRCEARGEAGLGKEANAWGREKGEGAVFGKRVGEGFGKGVGEELGKEVGGGACAGNGRVGRSGVNEGAGDNELNNKHITNI